VSDPSICRLNSPPVTDDSPNVFHGVRACGVDSGDPLDVECPRSATTVQSHKASGGGRLLDRRLLLEAFGQQRK